MENETKKIEVLENFKVEQLKFICEVLFYNKPHEMISRLVTKRKQAKEENNLKLLSLIDSDINTLVKNWREMGGSDMSITIDDKLVHLKGRIIK
jgi:hypothetical protein